MARPRTFDEERALDAAMRAFWLNGYEATSTQDLCEATGLGRSSIYNTFISKHQLFLRALAHYLDTMASPQIAVLEDPERSAVERIRAVFAMVIEVEFTGRVNGRSLGCLSVNATVELAGRDPRATELLGRDLDRRLAALRVALAAGQHDGEIIADRGADALARYLNAVIAGMRVAAQGGADRAVLESIAETSLAALTP
ncbi:transcriptional regulator [Streptomyces albus subsp. albus]|nr:transcriptional regulator [Streptomyces albus subsp. albus]